MRFSVVDDGSGFGRCRLDEQTVVTWERGNEFDNSNVDHVWICWFKCKAGRDKKSASTLLSPLIWRALHAKTCVADSSASERNKLIIVNINQFVTIK